MNFGHNENFMCPLLSAYLMIEMIGITPRCGLHLLLSYCVVGVGSQSRGGGLNVLSRMLACS